jgi:putative glutamine amidotransferase
MNPNANRIAPAGLNPPPPAPVVLVPACQRMLGRHPFHVAGKKYLDAIRLAGCVPLVVPAAQLEELPTLMALASGLLLTGSPSNVHPSHFGEAVHDPELPLDPERDGWTLPAIRMALSQGMPLLGICRGFQEVNVALGGSLYQAVQEQPGLADHRGDSHGPVEVEYGFSHPVQAVPDGFLARTLQGLSVVEQGHFMVNSVHGQGIKQLAPGLVVEARAPDGLVEAFTFDAPAGRPASFSLCMQWHPEWLAASNPVSKRIFETFGDACRAYLAHMSPGGDAQQAPRPESLPLTTTQ